MGSANHIKRIRRNRFSGFISLALTLSASSLVAAPLPGGSLDPTTIPKYVQKLVIPPEMPKVAVLLDKQGNEVDYYEIETVQFDQQILPMTGAGANGTSAFPKTTVWSYGAVGHPETRNYPAFTVEARSERTTRVKWINNLVDGNGNALPHLLGDVVDQNLHWANPVQDCIDGSVRTDCKGHDSMPYKGPVPIVTHVHGAHVGPESDGYPEAWWLPAGVDKTKYATRGTLWDQTAGYPTEDGAAVFEYPNDQEPTTLWYHDHTLGMTRLNVYAGPAGFWLVRGDLEERFDLPKPAPEVGDEYGNDPFSVHYKEIPIVIQDRSFNSDGSLFYPDNRAFFEGIDKTDLQIPLSPDSDIAPIWNPEAFFNTMVVNGRTWPYLDVAPSKYRLRLLNGSNSRFLILKFSDGTPFNVIGSDGGLLEATKQQTELLIGPAERYDVIVDFSNYKPGTQIILQNIGPDEPYGGGVPGDDFDSADPSTTGQIMAFNVKKLKIDKDKSRIPGKIRRIAPLKSTNTRQLSLNEEESSEVCAAVDSNDEFILPIQKLKGVLPPDCGGQGVPFAPKAALLGTYDPVAGTSLPLLWSELITENPGVGDVETWEIYNNTEDAHPIHLHLVQFQVVNREDRATGEVRAPEAIETGWKDTVIVYPGEIARVSAKFDREGLYVWHCHILEHEDNEMMRPYCVGNNCGGVAVAP